MASTSRKKNEEPRFFKIIHGDSISQQKLGIPEKFVQNYGGYLSSPVKLKVPGGSEWRVEIVKSEGEISLQNGWREFAEYYSVVDGSFLVFEFEKSNCEFNVLVFGKSATEINYPFTSFTNGDPDRANDLDQEQVPEEPHKKKIKLDSSAEALDQSCLTGIQRVSETVTQEKAPTDETKTNAVHKATSKFQSENPSFKIVMKPSLLKRGKLVIPQTFAKKYLNKDGDAAFKVLDGGTWLVNYYSKISAITKTRIGHTGWHKFVQDNHLEVGDVCVFELIDQAQTTFRVSISKHSEAANPFTSCGNSKESIERERRLKERKLLFSNPPEKFTSAHPFFHVVMTSTHLRRRGYNLNVPLNFISKLHLGTRTARLQVGNKFWSLRLIIYPHFGKSVFSGWVDFARDNSLEVGDVCFFELIDANNFLVKVSILRDNSEEFSN